MHPDNTSHNKQQGEISIREIVLKLLDWWRFLLSKWLIILLAGILGGGAGVLMSLVKKKKYIGQLTFILEDANSNPLSAYMGIASQFGVDLGGGGGSSGIFSDDNIMEFLQSRLMVEKALLSTVKVDNREITLAELYVEVNEMRKGWQKIPELANLHFLPTTPRDQYSLKQDSVLGTIYERIVKAELEVEKPNPKVSFISVKATTLNETFSKKFTETLVREAIDFYVDTKTRRNKISVDRLQGQADSLEILLNRKTYSAAAVQPFNTNPARQVATVGGELALRDKLILQTMYGEVIKNLELSKIAMAQDMPVIQIVDKPILPLKTERLGKVKAAIIGAFLFGFLTVILLIGRRIFRQILAEK
ncbi:hypothetical protein [Chitinophaga pinensis]|uniref:Lipopolysaccharide biosynthesis protein n=1 Tax=Chitinophaga pinensis (strain ATCC 43595 / DSM 2588 / LMG 13176 / NBRC 15968 / NCIMB 11800 / UQM 2034) TaxID=485918 RepID=A0A979G0Q2_CHIPD|nr:hypothetical protein [Chitinophaga pinensis]ACU58577.1 lipopolysaccharide biosynthesis protein [Chitinophaga pinensis DSM 2588]